jgi:hypothetical protein
LEIVAPWPFGLGKSTASFGAPSKVLPSKMQEHDAALTYHNTDCLIEATLDIPNFISGVRSGFIYED